MAGKSRSSSTSPCFRGCCSWMLGWIAAAVVVTTNHALTSASTHATSPHHGGSGGIHHYHHSNRQVASSSCTVDSWHPMVRDAGHAVLMMSTSSSEAAVPHTMVTNCPRGGSSAVRWQACNETNRDSVSSSTVRFENNTMYDFSEMIVGDPSQNRGPLKVLFLSADTGGGHRASAESLAKQFLIHFPGSTYDLLDIWTTDGVLPYRSLVKSYQHLSAHPNQWRALYHFSNWRPWAWAMDVHSVITCEKRIRRRIASYDPDVVVSVHPAMNYAPQISVRKLSEATGRHIPFFTVVTDLGTGHGTWFQRKMDKLYVASDRVYQLARKRGRAPTEKIMRTGLPIRHDFSVQAEAMGDRTTPEGQAYQHTIKTALGLPDDRPMLMLMGGGEGVGSLEAITNEVYAALAQHGINATICVVCGRNEKLQKTLNQRDWKATLTTSPDRATKHSRGLTRRRRRGSKAPSDTSSPLSPFGDVQVVGLGFVTNMAEFMVAADVLITKAGPGTIAEAAAVGLPVMLTSFLPGQEAGNVDYVVENGFGDFCHDPVEIGQRVATWLDDAPLMEKMSKSARLIGNPHAAADIVLDIGSITHTWKALNGPVTISTTLVASML